MTTYRKTTARNISPTRAAKVNGSVKSNALIKRNASNNTEAFQ